MGARPALPVRAQWAKALAGARQWLRRFVVCSLDHGVLPWPFAVSLAIKHGPNVYWVREGWRLGCGSACGAETRLEWWLISDDEAEYVHKAFPKDQDVTDHAILQCPKCMSVNFPGTNMSLIVTKDGQMYSVSGRRMYENDYRSVTRHLSSVCENTALRELPVKLVATECAALAKLIGNTPEAVEEMPLHETLLRREYVHNVNGLFPKPFFPSNGESEASAEGQANLTKYFTFIGRLLAKAMQDSRLLDLPFAPSFYKLLLQQPLTPADMAIIDPALHQSLTAMEALCNSRTRMKDDAPLTLDGCPIESLCLDFTLPGYPDVELVAGGKDQTVTIDNLQQYCELVREMYLATGLEVQRTALHAGFSQVLEIENLSVFSVAELEMLIRGSMEPWTASMLRDAIKCDHGFTAESRSAPKQTEHFMGFRCVASFGAQLKPVVMRLAWLAGPSASLSKSLASCPLTSSVSACDS